ncbi:hypothetical protein TWF569_006347 [Orbilia oligospora]|uniref:NmrA-like domain-containing protein n=1 Tax=Orbilia oligospora TaxID=2813651 RepID=A0A7C8JNI6_ORBOL|nr:hypothetical protein TWF102_010617 [Orbilia oligospora]KAF3100474.1 hypothetical protein TWF103_008202 [Orbilia oligospora]KAF3110917.1 hypothetical protein TWF706_000382 [Orbilia oligospora]KAF3135461.1 hypothetical protein TWF703_006005 [Orbilia oligospora]KAF3139052.1 hypothetical protein TWF594_006806 [Orbilia oligospora]
MSSSNYVSNIALVGAGGNQGKYIAEELVKGRRHTVTAITRADSKAKLPAGVVPKFVDYNDTSSLVEGLRGQDVLVITVSVAAPPDTQTKLIDAAKEAGVKFVIPNEWGYDSERNPQLLRDMLIGEKIIKIREYCQSKDIPFIGVNGGFWYEFSLGGSDIRYGFEIEKRQFTRIDSGDIKVSTSTWDQVGRGTAGLLSLKLYPESGEDKETISSFFGKSFCVESFRVSQNDMFEELKKVTGTTDADWKITNENHKERYDRAIKMFQQDGDWRGFGMAMYTRAFFPDQAAAMPYIQNKLLNLPQENFEESTKGAIEYEKTAAIYV